MDTLVHSIHTSERLSYRGCRRRWDWIFREGYYPKVTPKYFEFGTAYHHAMETYYDPETWYLVQAGGQAKKSLQAVTIKAFVDKVRNQRTAYLLKTGSEVLNDEDEKDYDERLELGVGMLKYYFTLSDRLDNFVPIQTEVSFEVPIVDPDDGLPLMCWKDDCYKHPGHIGVPVTYGGRIDLLVQDIDTNRVWILDWKTAARVDHEALLFLELDDQVGSYPWAMRMLGVDVAGFIYHQQKKGFPQPPKENATIRKGCRFSVNKQQDTDYETYLDTVMNEDTQAYLDGYYDEMLKYLKDEGVRFYNRAVISKSDTELRNIGRDIFAEAVEMVSPDTAMYASRGKMSCGGCAFREPCIGKTAGEDYVYTLDTMFDRLSPYWERNRPMNSDKRLT